MTTIALSRVHFPITTLGPGKRIGVWFQGCSIRCAGCISMDTWTADAGRTALSSLANLITPWLNEADGLTISGGEPFDQPAALTGLLRMWRQRSERSAFVFTGYELDAVSTWLSTNDGLIDALMTGPFEESTPQTTALRGSDNQILHVLTPLGGEFRQYERVTTERDKRLDAMFDDEGEIFFAGIPARGDFQKLGENLRRQGHRVQLSQQQVRSRK